MSKNSKNLDLMQVFDLNHALIPNWCETVNPVVRELVINLSFTIFHRIIWSSVGKYLKLILSQDEF